MMVGDLTNKGASPMYSKRSSGSSAVSSRVLTYLWKAVNLLSRSASPLSAPLR